MSSCVLKHKRATLERVEKYISEIYFTDVNLYGRVNTKTSCRCTLLRSLSKTQTYQNLETVKNGGFSYIAEGEQFKPLWSQHWVKVIIPAQLSNTENLYLHWDVSGAESLVCDEDGNLIQGMSHKRKELKVAFKSPNEDMAYWIQISCTGLFGAGNNGMINPPNPDQTYSLVSAHLFVRDPAKYEVFMDLSVLYDIAKESDDKTSLCYDAMYTANEIINIITLNNHSAESYLQAMNIGSNFLRHGGGSNAVSSRDTIHAIGNCHIDSAWLWPYKETIRKVARSWSTTLSLFDAGKVFNFAGSQVVQFSWLKRFYPKLYAALKVQVQKGNFIPVGGSWVEMDTNIPNAESMIRQFLYGQKFYREEFGVHSNILWLPDTFGYSGQLPQIMQICDVKYFLSQKLSWNLTNTFPHHTFIWKGIDQSRVLAHFPPGDTYESDLKIKDVLKTVSNNKDKGRTHDQMLLFGHGDGGGGPTPEMIDRLDRISAIPGMPRIVRSTPEKFFAAVEGSSNMLCEWWGELYFELHRGTYTTAAKLKESNRVAEFWMTDIEFLSSLDLNNLISCTKIEEMWKTVLFNQFHDILPGSSIEQVFIDAMEDYTNLLKLYNEEWERIRDVVMPNSKSFVVNPYNWTRRQVITMNDEEEVLVEIPSTYIGSVSLVTPADSAGAFVTEDGICLCNNLIKAVFTLDGRLKSLKHKATDRECLETGSVGNRFVIFDDVPLFWDAWDVMEYHVETRQEFHPTSIQVVESGPLRASVKITIPLGEYGDINLIATVLTETPYLLFKADVSWRASHKFLKVEFPLSVSATEAQYEIQSGFVSRPTHANTSWDSAKFEVSGHKWAYLGEPNFGMGLLSKSKYGFSAKHNCLTLSLLRSTKAPDKNADMDDHVIEYAIYPHDGPLYTSKIVQHAINFNHPLLLHSTPLDKITPRYKPTVNPARLINKTSLKISSDEVTVQAIKKAEDGKGLVVRLYEPYGKTVFNVSLSHDLLTRAFSINAVERETSKVSLPTSGNEVGPLKFTPFEIKTIYLELDLSDDMTNGSAFKKAKLDD